MASRKDREPSVSRPAESPPRPEPMAAALMSMGIASTNEGRAEVRALAAEQHQGPR